MGLQYLDYEFKSPMYKKFWENELENTIQICKSIIKIV